MSINFSFNLQTVTQGYANACRSIAESVIKLSNVETEKETNVNLEFDVTMVPNGNQTEIVRFVDNQIDNGMRAVMWHGHKSITTVKGKLNTKLDDGVILSGIASAVALATLKPNDRRANGGKFTATAITRLDEYGVGVNKRTQLLATDTLRKLAKQHAKDIATIRALPVSSGYERKSTKNSGAKRVEIVCSDSCELGKVLRLSGDSKQLDVIEAFACPSCNMKFHLKGTTPKVLTESTEIIKQTVSQQLVTTDTLGIQQISYLVLD